MNKRVILLKDVFCKQFKKQITQLFLVGAIGLVPISAFAQVYQITMKKSNASLSSVIAEIEKESGRCFSGCCIEPYVQEYRIRLPYCK